MGNIKIYVSAFRTNKKIKYLNRQYDYLHYMSHVRQRQQRKHPHGEIKIILPTVIKIYP